MGKTAMNENRIHTEGLLRFKIYAQYLYYFNSLIYTVVIRLFINKSYNTVTGLQYNKLN